MADEQEWWTEKVTGKRVERIGDHEGEVTYRFDGEEEQSRATESAFRERFAPPQVEEG